MKPELTPADIARHEEVFETQVNLQSRLLDFLEQEDEFQVLDEAWDEFNLYEDIPMNPEEPEPVLHFFPWALFYWRRDVEEDFLDAARDETVDDDIESLISDLSEDDASYVTLPPIAQMFMNSVDGADGPDGPAAGQTLTVNERQYIDAAARSPYSFFKVQAVGPGPFVTLEDLIEPDQKRVYAQALVDMLEDDDVIYAQIVSIDDTHILSGVAPAVLPGFAQEAIAQARARIEAMIPEMGEDWRYEIEYELRAFYQKLISDLQDTGDDEDGAIMTSTH